VRKFNENYVLKEIEKNYHNSFPGKKIKTVILSYKFRNDKTGYITSIFFCFDPDYAFIGYFCEIRFILMYAGVLCFIPAVEYI